MFSEYNQFVLRNTAQMPITRFTVPRVPKMIEAICPGCFKGFTKIGSMHRVSPRTSYMFPSHLFKTNFKNTELTKLSFFSTFMKTDAPIRYHNSSPKSKLSTERGLPLLLPGPRLARQPVLHGLTRFPPPRPRP